MTKLTRREGEGVTAFSIRKVQHDAWMEGMRTGTSRAMRKMTDEPGLPLASEAHSPYGDALSDNPAAHAADEWLAARALAQSVSPEQRAAIEANVLRRVAEKWNALWETAPEQDGPWWRGYWKGIKVAGSELRAEADHIEKRGE